mmetsp:Transcript_39186/g.94170  ORF Transcript_39186/g.94170 Transcript_39186/m.94170 type:complete len:209 (-) Transcript_39186:246-872(-)
MYWYPGGIGTLTWFWMHSGACSHTILHFGKGHVFGRRQCHLHSGSGHHDLQPRECPQSRWHRGCSQCVAHLGVAQDKTLVPLQVSFGQNMAQAGSVHFAWQPSNEFGSSFGHLVWQTGTLQSGLHSCSHAGVEQLQVQCGTQLFLCSSGTMVGAGLCSVPLVAFPAAVALSGSSWIPTTWESFAEVAVATNTAPCGGVHTLRPWAGLK